MHSSRPQWFRVRYSYHLCVASEGDNSLFVFSCAVVGTSRSSAPPNPTPPPPLAEATIARRLSFSLSTRNLTVVVDLTRTFIFFQHCNATLSFRLLLGCWDDTFLTCLDLMASVFHLAKASRPTRVSRFLSIRVALKYIRRYIERVFIIEEIC